MYIMNVRLGWQAATSSALHLSQGSKDHVMMHVAHLFAGYTGDSWHTCSETALMQLLLESVEHKG